MSRQPAGIRRALLARRFDVSGNHDRSPGDRYSPRDEEGCTRKKLRA